MISRATAPAGAGPSKAPPIAPASIAAPKNRIHRVRKVFLLPRGTPRWCCIVLSLSEAGPLARALRAGPELILLLAHYDMSTAILRVALFRRGRAERAFFTVTDRFHAVRRDSQRSQELFGRGGAAVP